MSGPVRTGLGWDSHRFVAGRRLILGGVEFPAAELGLDGHSDADVLTHAIMDALLLQTNVCSRERTPSDPPRYLQLCGGANWG